MLDSIRCWTRLTALLGIFACALSELTLAAESDICQNRSGQDLIRCIEASARGTPPPPPSATKPPPPATVPATAPRSAGSPATKAQVETLAPITALPEPPPFPPQDCTGRVDQELRRCLAAGGRLQPSAAVVPPPPVAPPAVPVAAAPESCDGKSGEALRLCIEQSAKRPLQSAAARTVPCTGYTAADQPLCVHRNSAIIECGNRKRYPDFDVCMRSNMIRAPEPKLADCRDVSPRAKSHCESRNRVYQSCTGDKIGYFVCLERHLGTDAVLTKR